MSSLLSSILFGVSFFAFIATVYYVGFRQSEAKRKMPSLPNELMLNILQFCDFATIREVSYTNKRLHQLVEKFSHRLARKHIWDLRITQSDKENSTFGDSVSVQIRETRRRAPWTLRIYKSALHVDDRGPRLTPEAIRDLIVSCKNEYRLPPWLALTVADPLAVALLVLDEILKRISIHELTLDCASPGFLSSVLAMLQKHRTRIHSLTVACKFVKYENLEPLPRMIDLLGVVEFTLDTITQFSSEDQRRFASALSNSKLTSCDLCRWTPLPKCLLVRAKFESVEAVSAVIEEWARGEREIVHHDLWGAVAFQDELFAGIKNCLRNVRGLRISLDGHGLDKCLKIEKTTLPEGVEHQRRLHAFYYRESRSTNFVLQSARLGFEWKGPFPDDAHPCAECSTSAELRQAAELLAALHSGIVPIGL